MQTEEENLNFISVSSVVIYLVHVFLSPDIPLTIPLTAHYFIIAPDIQSD